MLTERKKNPFQNSMKDRMAHFNVTVKHRWDN